MVSLTTPLCDCSNPLSGLQSAPTDADLAGMCQVCHSAQLAIVATERADEFQARSHEWFTKLSPVAREQRACNYEDMPVSRSLGDF